MELPYAEPYRIKMVENLHRSTRAEREKWIAEAGYNLFKLRSEHVYIDMLTDSGTGAMSDRQWAALMEGDESYAGASSFYNLKDSIREITGLEHVLPTHQGRAAENVLFSAIVKEGDWLPGNSHFDTTKGHIEFRKAHAVDCTVDEASDTDNTAGGQPVSMENIRGVSALARKYGVKLLIDSARFAENAYFIKTREPGYAEKSIVEIAREIYSYADYMTMSAKKDGLVNIGGFLAFRDEEDMRKCQMYSIMYEGFLTYGGMAGRDMNALAQGLRESTRFDYLDSRIRQVAYLASKLDEYGIPYQRPAGGHAIFVDAGKVLAKVPREEFQAQTLAIELYLEGGVRGVEIGALMADRDPVTRENRYPKLELLRLAVARRVYTNNHMDYVAAALKNVFDRRDTVTRGYRIVSELPIMRHFTVGLAKAE